VEHPLDVLIDYLVHDYNVSGGSSDEIIKSMALMNKKTAGEFQGPRSSS